MQKAFIPFPSEIEATAFFIFCAVDHTSDPGPEGSACAHGTGFQSDIEGALIQKLAPEVFAGRCKGLHLSVCSKIVKPFAQVVGPGNGPPSCHNHCANGNLSHFGCALRLVEGLPHVPLIVRHTGNLLRRERLI